MIGLSAAQINEHQSEAQKSHVRQIQGNCVATFTPYINFVQRMQR